MCKFTKTITIKCKKSSMNSNLKKTIFLMLYYFKMLNYFIDLH